MVETREKTVFWDVTPFCLVSKRKVHPITGNEGPEEE